MDLTTRSSCPTMASTAVRGSVKYSRWAAYDLQNIVYETMDQLKGPGTLSLVEMELACRFRLVPPAFVRPIKHLYITSH